LAHRVSLQSIIVASKSQVSCDLAGEGVILDVKSGMYYSLNAVGTQIWQLIQVPRAVSAVRDVLLDAYDVEPTCCEWDLLALLQALEEKGLIEVQGEVAT
jgi:hypothetical protein